MRVFRNRTDAGRRLAEKLSAYANRQDVIVLALPRGGVPVAYEVARALNAPLDIFVVRKLGVPGHEEFAMGAIGTGGVRVLNEEVVKGLRIPPYVVDAVTAKEQQELKRRESLYRGGRAPPDLRGLTVILVDDGLATGATMKAAIQALRQLRPARIVVAAPAASPDTCRELRSEVDEIICDITPEPFRAVGAWYEDFSQTTDEEVRDLLARQRRPEREGAASETIDPVLIEALRRGARTLTGAAEDYDRLMDLIGEAPFALLGEASHGTHEFYRERAEITKRLIKEKRFTAVAAEADWPDAWRVNRYVRGESEDLDAVEALADFRRFPTWMWRNTEVVEFVEWLRAHNAGLPPGAPKVGFYGIDLYSLHASAKAVLRYLRMVDPEAAKQAAERYACFDHFGEDTQVYGFMTGLRLAKSCEEEVIAQLVELQRRAGEYLRREGGEEELFNAEQNARIVKNAEEYYRTMFLKEVSSWNLRDRHMAETVESLAAHVGRHGEAPKIAIWAHNSHLGDARATEVSERGELNLGQLMRERHGRNAVLIGFTTYHGTVTAASDWDSPAERKQVRPALADSYEGLFHVSEPTRFLLIWSDGQQLEERLRGPRLERAIGVIYRPETERQSHYFRTRLPDQFDAVLHFDQTRAVEPLETTAGWVAGEAPETFPVGV
ncbi:MAG: Erythromycin esterase [Caulobacteraceae bacterium]|nr:Erythromycin esterase [Caulobacteraceae bacterium]